MAEASDADGAGTASVERAADQRLGRPGEVAAASYSVDDILFVIDQENDTVSADTSWDFSVDGFAGLNIQDTEAGNIVVRLRRGAPTDSLVVSSSSDIGLGTVSPAARLHVVGSGIIERDVAMGSSRTIKHAFAPLDPVRILAAVRELPLYRWKYRDDSSQAQHVGPMAEDVHSNVRHRPRRASSHSRRHSGPRLGGDSRDRRPVGSGAGSGSRR